MRLKLVNRYYYVFLVNIVASATIFTTLTVQSAANNVLLYKKIGLSSSDLPLLTSGIRDAIPREKISQNLPREEKIKAVNINSLYPNRNQIVAATKELCKQLIVCLETIESYLTYWKSAQKRGDGFSRQIKKHISFLTGAQQYAASYLGALTITLKQHITALNNEKAEKSRKCMLHLIADCLELRPFNNLPEVASDFKKVSLRKTNRYSNYFVRHLEAHAPPGHFRRHWKKYLTSVIGLATLGVVAYKNQEILKKWADLGIKVFQENVSEPIWDLIKLPFEEHPKLPMPSSEPWIYPEQQKIYKEKLKRYFELMNGLPPMDIEDRIEYPTEEKSALFVKFLSLFPRMVGEKSLKEIEKMINDLFKDFEALRGDGPGIETKPLTLEQQTYINDVVSKGILGDIISKDVADLPQNLYKKIINGTALALIDLQFQQAVIVETARLLKEGLELAHYWNTKAHSLWKVLRVMALFSVIPATLILYKTYNAFKNKKIAAAEPIKNLLRTIDRLLTPYYSSSKTIDYADQGLALYYINKLRRLGDQIPVDYHDSFEEDLNDLAALHFSADQKHAVILRIYNTYPFLSMKC